MHRISLACCFVALSLPVLSEAEEAKPAAEPAKPWISFGGSFTVDGYSQNNFLLGVPRSRTRDDQGEARVGVTSDHDEYVVQLLRLQTEFGVGDNLKAVMRADWAQGIWGIDEEMRSGAGAGYSRLFDHKDTNHGVHVDWAYLDYTHKPWALAGRLGRMKHGLGNLLVLDQDGEGLALTKTFRDASELTATWAQMSEGADALSDRDALGPGDESALDASLYTLAYSRSVGVWKLRPFAAFYQDQGDRDRKTYLPQGQQYFLARFQPQVSQATALGLAAEGKVSRFEGSGEFDFLTGQDHVANTNSGPNQLLDVNDGRLRGSNLYLNGKVAVGRGKLGLVLGRGSGDPDLGKGKGNINRIRTQGYFFVTEVWEDSVMPDEEGLTPQGLGAPAIRGYRELENTTLAQLNWWWEPTPRLSHTVSATWLRATEALHPWTDINTDGAIAPSEFGGGKSKDLGAEFDTQLAYKVQPALTCTLRGGVLLPGDAAGYLLLGRARWVDASGESHDLGAPWEARITVAYNFGPVKAGG